MKVAIAGGHGQIALILQRLLSEAGSSTIGIIRNPDHADDVRQAGGTPLVADLEHTDLETLAAQLGGVDAVVFAAGGGPGSGAARKLTVDRDAAILLADAAEQQGIRRYVLISSIGADTFDPDSEDVFQIYLRAKAEADADVRARDLDWTVIRPGGLTNEPPTGRVRIAESTGGGTVSRADVAAVVAEVLLHGRAVRRQLELIGGDTEITEALAGDR